SGGRPTPLIYSPLPGQPGRHRDLRSIASPATGPYPFDLERPGCPQQGSDSFKEVIQPHLPVRLPCYDLAPVTEFTFGRPLPLRGQVTDFGCPQRPWLDGRCVQGPGTYSPRRS